MTDCQDNIVGTWIVNAKMANNTDRISPELISFHADGTLTYLFLDTPSPDIPLFSGSKALGLWKKTGKNKYKFVSAERVGFVEPTEGPCCGNTAALIVRNSVTVKISKKNKDKAIMKGLLEGFPPFDICLKEAPLVTNNFTGELCRLEFPK